MFLKDVEDELVLRAGSSTAIEIPFSANPMPKVKWTFNNGAFTDTRRFKDETIIGMTSLTMAKVLRKDSGKYAVTMENKFGKASLTIKVTVIG